MWAYVSLALGVCACGPSSVLSVPLADGSGSDAADAADAGSDAARDADLGPGIPDLGMVSFSAQVQPIFDDSCDDSRCHDSVAPARDLDLSTSAASLAEMVAVASSQCPSVNLIVPGYPDDSYLVWKLEGAGPCFAGRRMPRGASALSANEIALVRAWIAQGALDN